MPRPETHEARVEFSNRVHDQTRPLLHRHTVPIIQQTYDWPTLHGTGVLLQIADVPFLISAAHVLEEVKTARAMFVPGEIDQAQTLRGEYAFSPPGDDRDIGVVRLDDDVVALLKANSWEFLRLDKTVLLKGDELPPAMYALYGYPIELHKREGAVVEPRSYWLGRRPHQKTASALGLKPEHHVALRLDHDADEHILSANLKRPPGLLGMSGCGVWLVCDDTDRETPESWSADSYVLAGIEHAFQERRDYIKVTTMTKVLQLIAGTFPELAAAIKLMRPVRRPYGQAFVTAERG